MFGVGDGAAVERGNGANHFDCAGFGVGGDFGASGKVTAFFCAAGNAEAAAFSRFRRTPAERFCGGLENGAEAVVLEIFEPKLEWIYFDGAGEFVHVRLAGEIVGGGGKAAIGTLAQRRFGIVEGDLLVVNFVRRADAGAAGVVVVKFPRRERAVVADVPLEISMTPQRDANKPR